MQKISQDILELKLTDQNSQEVSLKDLIKDYLVIYFYPKDDTPGCTKEACSFRDANLEMQKLGVGVVGISKDSSKSHHKFSEKFALNFPLLSDLEHKLQDAFGVWQKKKFMGREYFGTNRSTFVINASGEIVLEYLKVKPEGHAEEVLKDIKNLMN